MTDYCPECGAPIVHQCGCGFCLTCGLSGCGEEVMHEWTNDFFKP